MRQLPPLALAFLSLPLSGQSNDAPAATAVSLRPRDAREFVLGRGISTVVTVDLGAGELALIEVRSITAALRLVARNPSGRVIRELPRLPGARHWHTLRLLSDTAGRWTVTIDAPTVTQVSAEVEWTARRRATTDDRDGATIDSLVATAMRAEGPTAIPDSVPPMLRSALAIAQRPARSTRSDSQTTADVAFELSRALQRAGTLAAADSAASLARELRQRLVSNDHDTAIGSLQLATVRASRGQAASAESLLTQALAASSRQLGPDHPDVAAILLRLGVTANQRQRPAQAESLLVRAADLFEASPLSDDNSVVLARAAVGDIQAARARFREAEQSFRRAVSLAESRLGPTRVEVATVLRGHAFALLREGRLVAADSIYTRAYGILTRAGAPEDADVARLLFGWGRVMQQLGRYSAADTTLRRVLAIYERLYRGPHADVTSALHSVGWNLYLMGRVAEAEPLLRRAIQHWEVIVGTEHVSVAYPLHDLAIVLTDAGRLSEGEQLHTRALRLKERALGNEHPDVANSLSDLGVLHYYTGRLDEAERLLRRSLAIRERRLGPAARTVAISLNNLALVYMRQLRLAEAEPLLRRALAIDSATLGPRHPSVAGALGNLAKVFDMQGRREESMRLLADALAIQEAALGPAHPDLQDPLVNYGFQLQRQGRYAEAESTLRRAITVGEQAFGPVSRSATAPLAALGDVYAAQGRHREAAPLFRRALQAAQGRAGLATPATAAGLLNVADNARLRGVGADSTLPLLDQALRLFEEAVVENVNPATHVRAHRVRALVHKQAGARRAALADLTEAIRLAEQVRPQVGGNEEVRASFFSQFGELYELMIEWQLEGRDLSGALEYAERGRARVLLDQLAAGRVDLRASIPLSLRDSLVERESQARLRLAEYQRRLARLPTRSDLTEQARQMEAQRLGDSLRLADVAFRAAYDDVLNASPLWRDLVTAGGAPLSIDAIRQQLVPRGGLLAMYQIGETQSWLFLLGPVGAPEVFPLRVGALDAAALGTRPGPVTTTMLHRVMGSATDAAGTSILAALQRTRGAAGSGGPGLAVRRLHALRSILVPDRAWVRLRGASQLVLVPGQGLYGLPFEALVVRLGATPETTRFWLDDGPAIRYAASATTLHALERRPRSSLVDPLGPRAVLTLSNPEFGGRAPTSPAAAVSASATVPERSATPFVAQALSPLPGTAEESRAIREAFEQAPSLGEVISLQGNDATEAKLREALTGKRYVHLATHGLVDEQRDALFAALALTPPAQSAPDEDGFLQLHEIYQLRLAEVELAVLSACQTNVGVAVQSEGVFALSRGFLAAGARRVIASQWAVEDQATAHMMGTFFSAIATREQAASRVDFATELRDAKRRVRQDPRWAEPYYWAPLVLTGAR